MSIGLKNLLPTVCLLSIAGLSACSGPEGEEPVAMRDGLYALNAGGALGMGKTIEEICLTGSDDAAKIDKLVEAFFALTEDCSHQPEARVGNAIAGKMTCEIDEATGTRSAYKGRVTADSVALDITLQSYAPGEETSVDGKALAKRSGDCS